MNYYIIDDRWYDPDELYHHGIKGMRWGIRRYQNPDGSLTAAGRKKYAKEEYRNNKLSAKKEFNNAIEKANKSYDKTMSKYKNDLAKVDETHDKLQKATDEHYQAELRKYKADMDFWEPGDFYEEAASKYSKVMSEYNSTSASNSIARALAKTKVSDLYANKISNAEATKEQEYAKAGEQYIEQLRQAKNKYKEATRN